MLAGKPPPRREVADAASRMLYIENNIEHWRLFSMEYLWGQNKNSSLHRMFSAKVLLNKV